MVRKASGGIASLLILVFVWIVPVVFGVVVARKKNRSPHWFWLGIWPGVGWWVFIIMLILKPLQVCEKCKKKIPADSRVCPYCATETTFSAKTKEEIQEEKKKRNRKTGAAVCIVVGIMLCFVFVTMFSVAASFKSCEPYKHSLELIESNPIIQEYLGQDYRQTGMISGSLKSNANGMGSAYFSYKIKGQNGISVVYVDAEKENGVWIYKKINFYKEKQSCDVIDLLAEE